jgi:hypothetical protein
LFQVAGAGLQGTAKLTLHPEHLTDIQHNFKEILNLSSQIRHTFEYIYTIKTTPG